MVERPKPSAETVTNHFFVQETLRQSGIETTEVLVYLTKEGSTVVQCDEGILTGEGNVTVNFRIELAKYPDGLAAIIQHFEVKPRGEGHGYRAFEALKKLFESLSVSTLVAVSVRSDAEHFWQKLGFEEDNSSATNRVYSLRLPNT